MSGYKTCLKKVKKLTKKQQVYFAIKCAESVLHIWENECPNDKRPRIAIEAAYNSVISDFSDFANTYATANAASNAACASIGNASRAAWSAGHAAAAVHSVHTANSSTACACAARDAGLSWQ